jgi:hypothetical protein
MNTITTGSLNETGPVHITGNTPILTYAMSLLLSWLQIHGGCDVQAWTFDREEIEAIPAGYYAVVRVELRKLGQNDTLPTEEEIDYEMLFQGLTKEQVEQVVEMLYKK